MPERAIIHLNVADFAVAVERQADRQLCGRPVIVAPEAALRAVVYDMSEEAYRIGVRKAMPLARALARCRDAVVIPPHPARYEKAMARLLAHALPFSPLVEAADNQGHLFIDATGTTRLFGQAPDVAWRLRKAIHADFAVAPVWSVATNKLVAKAATRLVKPDGEYVVRAGDEAAALCKLPLHLVPGIATDDLHRLWEFNLRLAGEVARLSLDQLDVIVGPRNRMLHDAVRGIDDTPVLSSDRSPPAIRREHEFGDDTNCRDRIHAVLYAMVESTGAALRRAGLSAGRLGIVLDYSDGGRIVRSQGLRPPSANDIRLFETARQVLDRAWHRRVRIRHLRLACDRLDAAPVQRPLFEAQRREWERNERIVAALDTVRTRFGPEAIRTGRTLDPRLNEF